MTYTYMTILAGNALRNKLLKLRHKSGLFCTYKNKVCVTQ
jgi:hypothetical protein